MSDYNSNQHSTDEFWSNCTNLTNQIIPLNNLPLDRLSPVALAYIGDAVYELYIRSKFLVPPKRIADYHARVVTQVRAETQATYLQQIEPYLTSGEKEMVRRGRNAVTHKSRRSSGKIYQQASSLETLIGYLYLTDCDRLQDLFTKINMVSDVDG